jgi:hypothetical protein
VGIGEPITTMDESTLWTLEDGLPREWIARMKQARSGRLAGGTSSDARGF